ncbi:peptidyl-prolyl cis-trans isomerase B (cyclophilin B) [bacterium A37T11]|nr:peptidyl-prolyl cis-trans isomerase B (cyclophilin B) [bacterium A37T11]
MKYVIFLIGTLFFFQRSKADNSPYTYVSIMTDKGECIVRLYNQTPKHRDNFIKLVKAHYFDSLLFHRVINGFMIQGGDPDSRQAKAGQLLGDGGPAYTVDAEFNDSLFHKKGVLAAARDDNPAKASSASQFYLVQGKVLTDAKLDSIQTLRMKGRKIPAWQREVYKTKGGTPYLDQNYTVFGEVVKGLPLVDSIAAVPTDSNDRPLTDVRMNLTILNKKETKALERELAGLPAEKPNFFDKVKQYLKGDR